MISRERTLHASLQNNLLSLYTLLCIFGYKLGRKTKSLVFSYFLFMRTFLFLPLVLALALESKRSFRIKSTRVRTNMMLTHKNGISLHSVKESYLGRNENNKTKLARVNIKSSAFYIIKLRKIRFFVYLFTLLLL